MKICPVDLATCDRAGCRSGHCELAQDSPTLTLCWECGVIQSNGIVHGICIECVSLRHAAPREEKV